EDDEDQQGCGQRNNDTAAAPLADMSLVLRKRHTSIEEGALQLIQRRVVAVSPLAGLGQARAALQGAFLAALVPLLSGLCEAAVLTQAGAILLDPAPQTRPTTNQRLMGDVDPAFAHGSSSTGREQARVTQLTDHTLDKLVLVCACDQLVQCRAASGVLSPLSWLSQPEQNAPRDRLLLGCERIVDCVRAPRNSALHTAAVAIGLQGQHHPAPPLPQFEQGVLQEGQSPRLVRY